MATEERVICRIRVGNGQVAVLTGTPGNLSSDPDRPFDHTTALQDLPGKVDEIHDYGRHLFELLFDHVDVYAAFKGSIPLSGDSRVQLQVEIPDQVVPDLLRIRWEYLADRTIPNARKLAIDSHFRFIRRLQSAPSVSLPLLPERPRVLVIIANWKDPPGDYQTGGRTFRKIEHALQPTETKALSTLFSELEAGGLISGYDLIGGGLPPPHPQKPPSKAFIRQVLAQGIADNRPHHIIHFLAHGYLDETGDGNLVLTDGDRKAKTVHQKEFSTLFPDKHQVRLVMFAACQSAEQAIGHELSGLAPSLLQPGVAIPAVIAMQDEVSVGAAREFTGVFYQQLVSDGYIDSAVGEARRAVANLFEDEWGIPVLYLQSDEPRLFDPGQIPIGAGPTELQLQAQPPAHFVNRKDELGIYRRVLWEDLLGPQVCWLSGPKKVGKLTFLHQLRFVAHQLGHLHLLLRVHEDLAHSVMAPSEWLYGKLLELLQPLEGHPVAADHFSKLLEDRARSYPSIKNINLFLDGLDSLSKAIKRKIITFFYFQDFAANANFIMNDQGLGKLIYALAERYALGSMPHVRFLFASDQPFVPNLLNDYFFVDELRLFSGREPFLDLCEAYGLLRDRSVPRSVLNLVGQPDDGEYLPGPVADTLRRMQRLAILRGEAYLNSLEWAVLNGAGGDG